MLVLSPPLFEAPLWWLFVVVWQAFENNENDGKIGHFDYTEFCSSFFCSILIIYIAHECWLETHSTVEITVDGIAGDPCDRNHDLMYMWCIYTFPQGRLWKLSEKRKEYDRRRRRRRGCLFRTSNWCVHPLLGCAHETSASHRAHRPTQFLRAFFPIWSCALWRLFRRNMQCTTVKGRGKEYLRGK